MISEIEQSEVVVSILSNLGKLKEEKMQFDNVNQIIASLMRQNQKEFTTVKTPGSRQDQEIFDTTASRANTTLASILQSKLTTPGEKWAIFSSSDKEQMKNENVKRFYEELSDSVFDVTRDSDSQFYQKNHEFFLDLPAFGTGVMFIAEDVEEDEIIFDTRRLSEVYCEENNKGVIDTLYREFKFTARQAEQEFGAENLTDNIKTKLESNPAQKLDFLHVIIPIKDYLRITNKNPKKEKGDYKSIYISMSDKTIIKEAFFNDKPFVVARWSKRSGEPYGIGAAWEVLSDIEVLNILSMLQLEASELAIRPPLLATDEGVIGEPEWIPGGITYGAMTEDGKRLLEQVTFNFDVSKSLLAKEERIKNIETAFFVDQFRERDGVQPLTATEAIQNEEKRLALLSPQVKRLEDEYLHPVCIRIAKILLRNKKVVVPEELAGKPIKLEIEFVGPLSFTRRSSELSRYTRFIQNSATYLQVHPTGLDNFKLDDMIRTIAEKSGIPLKEMHKEKDRDNTRLQRAQQEQQIRELENMESGASTVEKLSKSGVLDEQ